MPQPELQSRPDDCPESEERADRRTIRWWLLLYGVSVVNVGAWFAVARVMSGRSEAYILQQLALSGLFVAACAFRSVLPRLDIERRCLWNTPLSSIFIGRSVATVAELCFAMQCALLILKLATLSGYESLRVVGLAVVPLIIVAQLACWYAVTSLNHLGHAIEELLWAAMVGLLAVSLGLAWVSMSGSIRLWLALGLAACIGAAILMLVVDVPMYLARWRQGRSCGIRYLPVREGLSDALSRRQVTHRWSEWRQEVPWMSLYFSVGVWLSLALVFI